MSTAKVPMLQKLAAALGDAAPVQERPQQVASSLVFDPSWTNQGTIKIWRVMDDGGNQIGSVIKNNAPYSKYRLVTPENGAGDSLKFSSKASLLAHLGITD